MHGLGKGTGGRKGREGKGGGVLSWMLLWLFVYSIGMV